MANERISFFDLVPFSDAEKHIKSPAQLKKIFIEGIRKNMLFYAANQTDKYVHMIRWGYEEVDEPPQERRFHEKEQKMVFTRGQMLSISNVDQFDKLFKGVLNEIDLFKDIEGFDELIEYQQTDCLYQIHADSKLLTAPSDFKGIGLSHVFIRESDLERIDQFLKPDPAAKETKQDQREKALIEWLKDKDPLVVRNTKKKDVWKELQKFDGRVFNAGRDTFFKKQQIINFQSGRKAKQQH
ncbi:hypothetical protein [Neptuniibacter sp.]|uniref:hypothetical protein n=1 Tax=Neptuniibacter sp. TaxID=1962643 RepID=UPI00262423C0|nr:hypothetical protein [Neptuniibacter sp.]MCP4596137.1 hypothetical protein [Neptuniibacter sp.]